VEDQQPAAGDLTVDGASTADVSETAEVDTEQSEADESAVAATESGPASKETDGDEAQGKDREKKAAKGKKKKAAKTKKDRDPESRRRIRRRIAVAAVLTSIMLFVGSAAFAGTTMHAYLSERATVATKLKVARTAADAITTLWSYTPENIDTLADRAAKYLSGDFAAQYRKVMGEIASPYKQHKISSSTEVTGAAVESLNVPNAIAIVYTNTTSKSGLKKNIPGLMYLAYRVNMTRDDHGRWLVTRMSTVTYVNMTPQL
jgi:Mce-associated membrane protein